MRFGSRHFGQAWRLPLVAAWLTCAHGLPGQTLTMTTGVKVLNALTNTAVALTNRCELRLTSSSDPMPGCTINLESIDAWLFLTGVKPSTISSTYLRQIKVSGAAAVAGANCRVVQYGQNGAVVIPQPSSFQPLSGFAGAEFTGAARSYNPWNYYTGTALTNLSSFKLKRGYQAVLAASPNGVNFSKCYVAQDGDLEVGLLPATLNKQVQFLYITPWRWTCKKGIAGDPGIPSLNVLWWYNWNINETSSPDLEYVPIKWGPYWPGLSQNWQSMGANTILGYNEPDNSGQANVPVGTAISDWTQVLGTGLRTGSPATTDGGRNSWLYPFASQADAAGYRVDFVAVHYYWSHNPADPSGCASQMYGFLQDIWNNTHRPIWITEWNNGANWTDNQWPVPTYAQQEACIAAMTQMLESTPFVERYALYNWVEDGRSLVTGAGAITPAGTAYSNLVSNLSYLQTMPDNGTRGVAEYLFSTNTWDTSGYYNNGMAVGAPEFTTGHTPQATAIALDGANSYVQLPANIATGSAFTFASWVYWNGGNNWQRIFDFGNGTSQYLFLTPKSGSGTLRFSITDGGPSAEQQLNAPALTPGAWTHVAVTLDGSTAALYVNGSKAASASLTLAPSAFSAILNYLGKSQFPADPTFNGKFDEVEITDYAMTAAQILALSRSAAVPPATSGAWEADANGEWSATTNWTSGIVANGAGFIADFSAANLTSNVTVKLDTPRTIGELRFGNLTGPQNWFLGGTNALTLDAIGPNMAVISVLQNSAAIAAPLINSAGLIKTGDGTLTVSAPANSITGPLQINGGIVNWNTSAELAPKIAYQPLQIESGAVLNINGSLTYSSGSAGVNGYLTLGNNAPVGLGTININPGGALIFTNQTGDPNSIIGQQGTGGYSLLNVNGGSFFWDGSGALSVGNAGGSGMLVVTNNGRATILAGANPDQRMIQMGRASTTSIGVVYLASGTLSTSRVFVRDGSGSGQSGVASFTFDGGTLKALANQTDWLQSASKSNNLALSAVTINAGGATIDANGFSVALNNPIASGGPGDGGLAVIDSSPGHNGELTLGGACSYQGPTVVSNGTLALGAAASIGISKSISVAAGAALDASRVVNGLSIGKEQTLGGSGLIKGGVIVNGTIAPGGISIGALTFETAPQLNGTTVIRVDRNNGTPLNDQIVLASGTLSYGDTLVVSNLATPLMAGDSFKIFAADSYNGTFAIMNLPSLGPGLAWNTNALNNGFLSVVGTAAAQFTAVIPDSSGNFHFTGDGVAGATYQLQGAASLVPPILWVSVTNAVADPGGRFGLSDLSATNFPIRFYRVISTY